MANDQYATKELKVVTNLRVLQPFEGSNHRVMKRLLTGKDEKGVKVDFTRLPLSPKQLVQARLGRLEGANEADQQYLRGVYVDTSTAVLPNPSGDDVKFDPEHPLVYCLAPETKLNPYNLDITQEQYDSSTGFRLTAEQANELRNKPYALPKVRRDFLEAQLEGDTKLTDDYIADVEKSLGMKFDNVMGLWLPQNKGLRLLCVGRIGDLRSGALGYGNLDFNIGCLVGYVAEPQSVAKKLGVSLDALL